MIEGKKGRFLNIIIIPMSFVIAYAKVRQVNGVYQHLVVDSRTLQRLSLKDIRHVCLPFTFLVIYHRLTSF